MEGRVCASHRTNVHSKRQKIGWRDKYFYGISPHKDRVRETLESIHMAKNHEVIIIGAGVIGCSIGYHLARKRLKPLITEGQTPFRFKNLLDSLNPPQGLKRALCSWLTIFFGEEIFLGRSIFDKK